MTPQVQGQPVSLDTVFKQHGFYVANVCLSREQFIEVLGPPQRTDWEDGLGPCDYWAFEFPCGLGLVFPYPHYAACGAIMVEDPDVHHAMRHSPFAREHCQTLDGFLREEMQRVALRFPDRAAKFLTLQAFQVWRVDDNDNVFAVGDPVSESDAKCWIAELESHGHKQMFYYRPVAS